jgi:uncharacterized protein
MYIIVGIDPGKTSAIAAIDLNGKLIRSAHKTFAGADWLTNEIRSIGIPVIIAGDNPEVSPMVRKINASFSARLFSPSRELPVEEKRLIAKGSDIRDPHERDAYAAAVKAYRNYTNKFKQAEHIANGIDFKDIDMIKAKVVNRYSISEAIENRKANRR